MKKLSLVLAVILLIFALSGCKTRPFRDYYHEATKKEAQTLANNVLHGDYYSFSNFSLQGSYVERYGNGTIMYYEKDLVCSHRKFEGTITHVYENPSEPSKSYKHVYEYSMVNGKILETKTIGDKITTQMFEVKDGLKLLQPIQKLFGWYKKIIHGMADGTMPLNCIYFGDNEPTKIKIVPTINLATFLELGEKVGYGDAFIAYDEEYRIKAALLRFEFAVDDLSDVVGYGNNLVSVSADMSLLPL